jgi:hypothetical protein
LIKTTQHNSDEHTHETKTLEGTMVDKLVVAPELLLIDVERASVRYGRSYVDNASAISETLATTMFSKAILLEVTTVGEDDGLTPWDGQAGLIRGSQITPLPQLRPGGNGGDEYTTAASRWTVFPVTAKHNIESRHEKTGFQRYHGAKMQTAASTPKSVAVSFPDGGWEQEQHGEDARVIGYVDGEPIQSPAGVDFTWGETVVRAHSFMTLKPTSFEMVREDFRTEPGQKIGIVVARRSPIAHDQARATISVDLSRYFGPDNSLGNSLNIQTGQILADSKPRVRIRKCSHPDLILL